METRNFYTSTGTCLQIENTTEYKDFMLATAREIGAKIKRRFGKCGKIDIKTTPRDLVTKTDKLACKWFINKIQKRFPSHGIVIEEDDPINEKAAWKWIIDPLDGTDNFANNIPTYSIIVALQFNGKTVLSCVYDPQNKIMYHAELDKGAFRNNVPVKTSNQNSIEFSRGMTNDSLKLTRKELLDILVDTGTGDSITAASIGTIGLTAAYLAIGGIHWMFINGGKKPWDIAGIILLIKEAGCEVLTREGKTWHDPEECFIAANPALSRKIAQLYC